MSKGENIVKWINWHRISWLGHLERMEEDRMPRKIFTQELKGTRRKEDPGKDGKRKKKEILSAGSEKMESVGGRSEKMEGPCSTGQNSKGAIMPMEEEKEEEEEFRFIISKQANKVCST